MAEKFDFKITIDNVLGGHSSTEYNSGDGQFLNSIAIDPDLPVDFGNNQVTAGGQITPSSYASFSGNNVNATPIAIITNPKDSLVYIILENGRLISYNSALASETLVGTVAEDTAGGGFYYNNYIYITGTGATLDYDAQTATFNVGATLTGGTSGATAVIVSDRDDGATGTLSLKSVTGTFQDNETITDDGGTPGSATSNGTVQTGTDVSRYGPLDGTPTLTDGVWIGSTLGGQTALTNETYPSIGSVSYPNHWGHAHSDGQAYFLDFKDGQGLVHSIKTTKGTDEGDTDDGSAYNVLDLPFGYKPTDIISYGTDLMISAIQTDDGTIMQGDSALFIWDPTDVDSFYRQVPIPRALVTALHNHNGLAYAFYGTTSFGFEVGVYDGAYGVEQIDFFEEGHSPFAGGVDSYGGRIVLGTSFTEPANAAGVFGIGYKDKKLPRSAKHNIVRSTLASSTPVISVVKYIQQASGSVPRVINGGRDQAPTYTLDKLSATTRNSIFRSEIFNIGRPFKIMKVRQPLSTAVDANTSIVPKLHYDESSSTTTLPTINNTNYSGQKTIVYKKQQIDESSTASVVGDHNFFYELNFAGTTAISALLPITIEGNFKDD